MTTPTSQTPLRHTGPLPHPDPAHDHDLVGLRGDDLTRLERRRQTAMVSTPDGAREHAWADTLATSLHDLAAPASDLHAGHVLESVAVRRHSRRTRRGLLAVVGLLGAVAIGTAALWMWTAPDRVWVAPRLEIDAMSQRRGRPDPVEHGDVLTVGQPLMLDIHTSGPGTLFVTERSAYGHQRPLAPTSGRWEVQAGRHAVAVPADVSHSPASATYVAWLCPPGTAAPAQRLCVHERLRVTWVWPPKP